MRVAPIGGDFGTRLREWRVAGLDLIETRYAPGHQLPLHAHALPNVTLVMSGSLSEMTRLSQLDCKRGVVLSRKALEPHADVFGPEGGRCFSVQFPSAWRQRLEPFDQVERTAIVISRGQPSYLVQQLYREACRRDSAQALAVEGLALLLLGALSRLSDSSVRPPRWLRRAEEYVRENWRRPFTLESLAADSRVHPVHLAREFRRHFGITPAGYVRRLRIEAAEHELVASDASLSAIALRCGFFDHSHFTREFRRQVGCTPSGYRRMHRTRCQPRSS